MDGSALSALPNSVTACLATVLRSVACFDPLHRPSRTGVPLARRYSGALAAGALAACILLTFRTGEAAATLATAERYAAEPITDDVRAHRNTPVPGSNPGPHAAPAAALGPLQPRLSSDGAGPLIARENRSVAFGNFDLTVRLRTLSGKERDTSRLAVRLLTPNDYYAVDVDPFRNRVAFVLVLQGIGTEIEAVDSDIRLDAWHTLAVHAEDDQFLVSLDGIWLFTARDRTISGPGQIVIWTTSVRNVTQFDDLAVVPRPAQRSSLNQGVPGAVR